MGRLPRYTVGQARGLLILLMRVGHYSCGSPPHLRSEDAEQVVSTGRVARHRVGKPALVGNGPIEQPETWTRPLGAGFRRYDAPEAR